MEGLTIIDGVVAGVIIISALLAYARGVVRETMAILGWIGAAVVGFMFASSVRPLIEEIKLPTIGPIKGGMPFADNCEIATIVSFAAIFAATLVIVSLFTPLFSSLVRRSALGSVDQAIGFVFGVLRGILLIAVAFFVYETVGTSQSWAMVDDSRSALVFSQITDRISEDGPQDALGWIVGQYEALIGNCQ